MYLCDELYAVKTVLTNHHPAFRGSKALNWMYEAIHDALEGTELFVLERSALEAAGSLRIKDPVRMDSMVRMLFSEPGKYFIECSHAERDEYIKMFHNKSSGEIPDERVNPKRIGILVNITSRGKGYIRPIWSVPKGIAVNLSAGPEFDRAENEAMRVLGRIGISMGLGYIDTDEMSGSTFSEFKKGFDNKELPAQFYEDLPLMELEEIPKTKEWYTALFRQFKISRYSGFLMDPKSELAQMEHSLTMGLAQRDMIESARRDLDGEFIYAVALLAVLRSQRDTDLIACKERRARSALRVRRPKLEDGALPRLSVLSMNKVYAQSSNNSGRSGVTERASHSAGRIRHLVAGHLFLARSGKMVWRREHFRGSLDRAFVKKVK